MKRPLAIPWLCLFGLLAAAILGASYVETRLDRDQDQRLFELASDIAKEEAKWEGVTIGDKTPFMWSKNLSVGHGLAMDVTRIRHWVLAALLLHTVVTLVFLYRRSDEPEHNKAPAADAAPPGAPTSPPSAQRS